MKEAVRDLIFSSNDDGARFLAVAMHSALKRYRGAVPIRVDILEGYGGLSAENHRLLERIVASHAPATIRFLPIEPLVESYRALITPPASSRWNIFAWMPVFGPDLVADAVGNMVYLDVDTLVNADLDELFRIDLGTNVIAAVYENHRRDGASELNYEWDRGILPDEASRYFNDGVLVFNVERYRRERCLEKLLEWYAAHKDVAFRIEQDALNAVYWNRVLPLPAKWNYHDRTVRKYCLKRRRGDFWDGNYPVDCLEAALRPAILHFWGRKKPWNPSHRPYRKLYHQALAEIGLEVPPEQHIACFNNAINWLAEKIIAWRYARFVSARRWPKRESLPRWQPTDGHIRDVAFSCNDQGVPYLCVSVWSLLVNYRGAEPIRINVFEGFGGHSAESKRRLAGIVGRFPNASLRYVNVDETVKPFADLIMNRKNSRWNVFTWTPVFTPALLPDAVGNVIHFDIDMLFVGDISPLFELELGTNLIATTYEYDFDNASARAAIWDKGILPPSVERYFNTGVLVFAAGPCREERTWEQILTWYREHYEIADRIEQDAWNALYWQRNLALPIKWNFHDRNIKGYARWSLADRYWLGNPPRDCLEASIAPKILHFWGPKKPWKVSHRPYRKLYHTAMRAVGLQPPAEGVLAPIYNIINRQRLLRVHRRLLSLS